MGKEEENIKLNEAYFIIKNYTKMVALGHSNGFILYGETGIGKSYNVFKAFNELDIDFVTLSGHITPFELYRFIYINRDKKIILDDVDILKNEINLNLLKACLGDSKRVSYTSFHINDIPEEFIFNGGLILILNDSPFYSESLKAVESRVLTYRMRFNFKDKLKIMESLVREDYKELNLKEREEIFNFIKENTSEATKNFNLRLLYLCYEFYIYDRENFKKLALSLFDNDDELSLFYSCKDWREWAEKTGKSKRMYYYMRMNVQKGKE